MRNDTAGDPVTGLRWTHRTTQRIADELKTLGIEVSPKTVAKLLKQMGFSLRVNHKKLSAGSGADRDEQFTYITEMRESFVTRRLPVISVDTKKKELVGTFKNGGVTWQRNAIAVNDHDFRSRADGIAIPYGVYDIQANRGTLFVGTSHDTPKFAVANLERWWRYDGQWRYPDAKKLLILADGGGSNAPRTRAWKYWLQDLLCDRHGLSVTVCHYPTGASKWNPIEHRMFSEISKNWAGVPLDSYPTILNYARSTTTSKGLTVRSYLVQTTYAKGQRVTDEEMSHLKVEPHLTQPKRNYTLRPR